MDCRETALKLRQELHDRFASTSSRRHWQILVFHARSDMAFGYLESERFHELGNLMEECQEDLWKVTADEERLPFEYAKYNYLKSLLQMANRDVDEALKSSRKAIRLLKTCSDGTRLASYYEFTRATLLYHAGNRGEALVLHRRVQQEREAWGQSDRGYLESCSIVARILFRLEQFQGARRGFEEILRETKLSDPESARCKFYLSRIYENRLLASSSFKSKALRGEADDFLAKHKAQIPHDIKSEGELAHDYACCIHSRLTGGLSGINHDN
ncbi:hypothetical protein F4778DRAFT_712714 [Xylariomycetidae sp. FL2044]|nr:hypothetical protein F4778DRAFT_712714 [Xylariomycetidae sp. FL2044]